MEQGVTIAICTFNGSNTIEKALVSVINLHIPQFTSIELLIVDNNSTDNTISICKSFLSGYSIPFSIKFLFEAKSGAIYARRKALENAQYDWLLICDDDNLLQIDYVDNAIKILSKNKNIGALGGKGIPQFTEAHPIWFNRFSKSYAVGPQNETNGKIRHSNASLYGAGTFFNVNALKSMYRLGFENVMIGPNQNILTRGEDTEWCYWLLLQKKEIWYSDSLKFQHLINPNRLTWSYYKKLKKGIASGSALLFGYSLLLKGKRTMVHFFIAYFFKLFTLFVLLLKYYPSKLLNKQNKDFEVNYFIILVKFRSFLQNAMLACKNHLTILKLINCLK